MADFKEPGEPQPGNAGGEQPHIPDSIAALQGLWGFEAELAPTFLDAVRPHTEETFSESDCAVAALSQALEKYREWTQASIEPDAETADEPGHF